MYRRVNIPFFVSVFNAFVEFFEHIVRMVRYAILTERIKRGYVDDAHVRDFVKILAGIGNIRR